MIINKDLKHRKQELLHYFRARANEILSELVISHAPDDCKGKAKAVNKDLVKSKETLLAILIATAQQEHWTNRELLEVILMITYTNNVVLLETRNLVWEYDYMAFSRRVGELWEPFCKLCFQYPDVNLSLFIPPLFEDVKKDLTTEIQSYIQNLSINQQEKQQLQKYYDKVWGLVTSGEIQLECDLHFSQNGSKYIVDFKSGFGSNEKGNTNRLLLVGSIYKNIETENYKCMIFVRSTDNNHYLNTLQNSGLWETSCGNDTYTKIEQFTGYNIQNWILHNINWMEDFTEQMRNTIISKDLESYLIW